MTSQANSRCTRQVAESQAGRGRELVRVLAAVVDGLGQGRVVGLLTAVAIASLLVRSVGVTATWPVPAATIVRSCAPAGAANARNSARDAAAILDAGKVTPRVDTGLLFLAVGRAAVQPPRQPFDTARNSSGRHAEGRHEDGLDRRVAIGRTYAFGVRTTFGDARRLPPPAV